MFKRYIYFFLLTVPLAHSLVNLSLLLNSATRQGRLRFILSEFLFVSYDIVLYSTQKKNSITLTLLQSYATFVTVIWLRDLPRFTPQVLQKLEVHHHQNKTWSVQRWSAKGLVISHKVPRFHEEHFKTVRRVVKVGGGGVSGGEGALILRLLRRSFTSTEKVSFYGKGSFL